MRTLGPIAVLVAAAVAATGASAGAQLNSRAAVGACLHAHKVWYDEGASAKTYNAKFRALMPPGVVGDLGLIDHGSMTIPGYNPGPEVDNALLFFFANPALAAAGEERLADVWVYGQGFPAGAMGLALLNAVAGAKTPSRAQLSTVEERYANVVIIWQYPRVHRAVSARIVDACVKRS